MFKYITNANLQHTSIDIYLKWSVSSYIRFTVIKYTENSVFHCSETTYSDIATLFFSNAVSSETITV